MNEGQVVMVDPENRNTFTDCTWNEPTDIEEQRSWRLIRSAKASDDGTRVTLEDLKIRYGLMGQ